MPLYVREPELELNRQVGLIRLNANKNTRSSWGGKRDRAPELMRGQLAWRLNTF